MPRERLFRWMRVRYNQSDAHVFKMTYRRALPRADGGRIGGR